MTNPTNAKAPTVAPVEAFKNLSFAQCNLNLDTSRSPVSDEKTFATLQAAFALAGHTLQRTNSDDGPVAFYAQRWGLVRQLATLADVQRFLEQIGGVQ